MSNDRVSLENARLDTQNRDIYLGLDLVLTNNASRCTSSLPPSIYAARYTFYSTSDQLHQRKLGDSIRSQ